MCGFLYINDIKSINKNYLEDAKNRLSLRGPDFQKSEIINNHLFFHSRLSIQGLDNKANQPFFSKDKKYLLLYNGEIFNIHYLAKKINYPIEELIASGDTPLLMSLLLRLGPSIIPEIEGMFSFVFMNLKEMSGFAVRDHLGIKPLYYYAYKNYLIFSSQIKAIRDLKISNNKICSEALLLFNLLGSIPDPFCIYENINSIKPGSILNFKNGEVIGIKDYIDTKNNWDENNYEKNWTNKDHFEYIKEALIRSINRHMISDVDLSILLSSGLDSTICAMLMSKIDEKSKLAGFTLNFDSNKKFEESLSARSIASKFGINHFSKSINKNDFMNSINKIFYDMDSPSIDGFNTWFACNEIKNKGYKVTVSGAGGDELFYGYTYYYDFKRILVLRILNLLINNKNIYASSILDLLPLKVSNKIHNIKKFLYENKNMHLWLLERGSARKINSEYSKLTSQILNELAGDLSELKLIDKLNYLDNKFYLTNQLLRDSDWASMSNGVELRVPLVSYKLINELNISRELFKRLGKSKLFSKVFAKYYLEDLPIKRGRKKIGFNFPLSDWLLTNKKENLNEVILQNYFAN